MADSLRSTRTILSSGSYTTTQTGADLQNVTGRRMVLLVNVSDASGGGSVTPSLQIKDPVSGNYFTVWTAAAALTSNALYGYAFSDSDSGGAWTEIVPFGFAGLTYRWLFTANNASALIYSASEQVTW